MTTIEERDFTCTVGGSNKYYSILIETIPGGHQVKCLFGAIGSSPQTTIKSKKPLTLDEARKLVASLVKERFGKGYLQSGVGAPVMTAAPTTRDDSGVYPQLLNDIDDETLERLLDDPRYGMQEKKNGKRRMVKSDRTTAHGINRKGQIVSLTKVVADDLAGANNLVDGEEIGEVEWLFDMLVARGKDLRKSAFITRHAQLCAIVTRTPHVKILPLWVTASDKRREFTRLKAEHAEGVVFKLLSAPYTPGRPSKGGDQTKYKFWKECDAVVLEGREGKRSVGLEVAGPGLKRRVFIGNVTIPANYDVPAPGTVVTVRYLYATDNNILYQPQYEGPRDDKTAHECLLSQLQYEAEES